MKLRDKLVKFVLKPPLWLDIAVWVMCFASLAATITLYFSGLGLNLWAIPVYVAAAVFLLLSIYAVLTLAGVPARMSGSVGLRSFFTSYSTRAFIYALCSVIFNIGYVVFGVVIAVLERSVWLGALVGYHLFLMLPRALVLFTAKLKGRAAGADEVKQQYRAYTYCGLMLVLLAVALIPVIRLVIDDKNSYNYFVGTIVYVTAIALYTFVKFALAVHNLRKAHRQNDMALIAVKNTSFADALISLFVLQAMMLKELGRASRLSAVLNPVMGGAVSIAILSMGVFMLIKGIRLLSSFKSDADGESR